MIKTHKTIYYGVNVQEEAGHYWIVDDNGNDEYFNTTPPSKFDIDAYRERNV